MRAPPNVLDIWELNEYSGALWELNEYSGALWELNEYSGEPYLCPATRLSHTNLLKISEVIFYDQIRNPN